MLWRALTANGGVQASTKKRTRGGKRLLTCGPNEYFENCVKIGLIFCIDVEAAQKGREVARSFGCGLVMTIGKENEGKIVKSPPLNSKLLAM
jgi:hypothetical protein